MKRTACSPLIPVLAILLCLMAALPFLMEYAARQAASDRLVATAGRLRLEHPDWEAGYLSAAFEPEASEEVMAAGRQALADHGYTEEAPLIWQHRFFPLPSHVLLLAAAVVLAALSLLVLWLLIRRQAEQSRQQDLENRRLTVRLLEAQSLAAVNDRLKAFIENIAHQIKTPVSRALTSTELLAEDLAAPAASAQTDTAVPPTVRLRENLDSLEDIRRLTERLLSIGRLEAGEVLFSSEPFRLMDLLTDVLADLPASKPYRLLLSPETGGFLWHGSYEWTREALANLVKNAAEHDPSDEPLEVSLEQEGDGYRLTLRDHGPGIAPEDLPHLFDRFSRPQDMKKGHVGLGLNLAKLIVEGQHGKLLADSHPQGGAVFTLLLPDFSTLR